MKTIYVSIDGVRYRMSRDGLEIDNGTGWESFDTDNEPDAHEKAAFDALEQLELDVNGKVELGINRK